MLKYFFISHFAPQYYYKLMLIIEKKMYAQKLENIYIFIEQLGMYISRK